MYLLFIRVKLSPFTLPTHLLSVFDVPFSMIIVVFFVAALFLGLKVSTTFSASFSLPSTEYLALYDLYISTNGAHWNWRLPYTTNGYPWKFVVPEENPCSATNPWQGIACTSTCGTKQCYIQAITLSDYGLEGTIPDTTGRFPFAENLVLSVNAIVGTIPPSIGNLTSAQTLDLSVNGLNGIIPSSLGKLTKLTSLLLHSNNITGSIPVALSNLTALTILDLESNSLTGRIPEELGNNMKSMEYLYLAMNNLTGTIPSYEHALNLVRIYLYRNQLTGCVPPKWSNISRINSIRFEENMLSCTIPEELSKLKLLSILDLSTNSLVGTIPEVLSQLPELTQLRLYNNQLVGTIPSVLSNIATLLDIFLYHNQLTGTISPMFSQWTSIETMALYFNYLTGPVPESYGDMITIDYFALNNNLFNSTIPSSLGNLQIATEFVLNSNMLTGTIPPSLGNLSFAAEFYLHYNYLTGTIPESLGNLTYAEYFFLSSNQLTGTLPSSLGNMTNMFDFQVNLNHLTGTIPSSFAGFSLSVTGNIDLSDNIFTGTLPPFGKNWTDLVTFAAYNNELSGSIPGSLGEVLTMKKFYVNNNQLTGSVPDALSGMMGLWQCYLHDNLLTGTLPTTLTWSRIQVLYFYNNILSGHWFEYSQYFPILQAIDVSNNILSGSISNEWFSNMTLLKSITLNNNQFTGSFPSTMFANKNLTSIVLAANCFSGTLPDTICSSIMLTQVIFDGLHSASNCIKHAIHMIPDSGIVVQNSVSGTIPSCLLQLQSLSVLHLGGNSFSGSIPNVPLSSKLTDLILSSNVLTGSVPSYLWHSNVTSLDLSFNRLQGTPPSDMLPHAQLSNTNNVTVKLDNNQFSGIVPIVLLDLPVNNVNVLEGNMFSCNVDRSNIPSNDPKYDSYNCGSDSTNYSLILFGGICFIVIILILIASRLWFSWKLTIQSALSGTIDNNVKAILNRFQDCTTIIAFFFVLSGMLLHGLLSLFYTTYTDSYVWTVSAIYKSGIVPSVLVFVWLLALLLLILTQLPRSIRISQKPGNSEEDITEEELGTRPVPWKINWLAPLIVLCNVVVVTTVNGIFVSAVRSDYTSQQLIGIAFALSIFKVGLNYLSSDLSVSVGDNAIVGICLFNNLVAPFLAELFVSSDCFLYIVSKQPSLSFMYDIYSCPVITYEYITLPCNFNTAVEKNLGIPTELSLSPPFHYSYQCSFSLISSYSYVFIFRYILSGLIAPCMIWLLRKLTSTVSCFTRIKPIIDRLIPPLWRVYDEKDIASVHYYLEGLERFVCRSLRPRFVVNIVTDLSMLICFGAMFPPLAFVIAVSLWKETMDIRLTSTRYQELIESIDDVLLKERMSSLGILMQQEYVAAEPEIVNGVWYGLIVTSWIWAFVLFDTLSASTGMIGSVWIVVLMLVAPFILWYVEARINKPPGSARDTRGGSVLEVKNPVLFGTDTSRGSMIAKVKQERSLADKNNEL